jgi:DNA polymerase-4
MDAGADGRKIIHCDCDCFFAAVEIRDDPSLAELPIAVGGSHRRRGVIATCNYRAREYGIHSAMPTARALRLCPGLVLIPPDFEKYREAAMAVRRIFHRFTDRVEPLSLDEAYLDVSDSEHCRGSATLIAREVRSAIRREVGITASAGVAPNKFLAKIASDWRKPDGLFVVCPDDVDTFVSGLPVRKLSGVGKATERKLDRFGVVTCGDLRRIGLAELVDAFGAFGHRLYELSRGIDNRPVMVERIRKSLSVEQTYAADLPDLDSCLAKLPELFMQFRQRLRRLDDRYQVTRQFLKIRFDDFTITTVERHCPGGVALESYQRLCDEGWRRGTRPVRLLGVGVRLADMAPGSGGRQLALFDA